MNGVQRMISKEEEREVCAEAMEILRQTGLNVSDGEHRSLKAADFGLSRLRREGLQVITLIETERIGVKVLILLAGQTMVEHWHPRRDNDPGKEETLRCVYGICRVYTPGENTMTNGYLPEDSNGPIRHYTCRNETTLRPTDQLTIPAGTRHWFQALREATGAPGEGCVVLSFSNRVSDLEDCFTDPSVKRQTVYE